MSGLCSLPPDTRSQRRVREYLCMVFAAPTGSRAPCGGSQFDMGRPGLPATNSPALSPAAYGRAARPEKRRFALSSDLPLSGQSTDRPIDRPRVRASKSDAELSCGEKLTGPPLSQHESFLRPNPGGGGGGALASFSKYPIPFSLLCTLYLLLPTFETLDWSTLGRARAREG